MALSERQRQKKVERRSKKRKQSRKSVAALLQPGRKASSYASYPVHECLAPSGIFETGIGVVIAARKTSHGGIAVSAFVLDVYCLGVKNALFNTASELEYEQSIRRRLMQGHDGQHFERVHVACAKKLVEGAVDYAQSFGFSPHADYRNAKGIFDGVDAVTCPVKYRYGSDGKPFYIQGPHESVSQARRIVDKLHSACGEDGYHYIISVGRDLSTKSID